MTWWLIILIVWSVAGAAFAWGISPEDGDRFDYEKVTIATAIGSLLLSAFLGPVAFIVALIFIPYALGRGIKERKREREEMEK